MKDNSELAIFDLDKEKNGQEDSAQKYDLEYFTNLLKQDIFNNSEKINEDNKDDNEENKEIIDDTLEENNKEKKNIKTKSNNDNNYNINNIYIL